MWSRFREFPAAAFVGKTSPVVGELLSLAEMPFLHLPESRTYINLDHVMFVEYLKGKTQKDALVVKVFFAGVPSATIFRGRDAMALMNRLGNESRTADGELEDDRDTLVGKLFK
jgi:hypothetical protein